MVVFVLAAGFTSICHQSLVINGSEVSLSQVSVKPSPTVWKYHQKENKGIVNYPDNYNPQKSFIVRNENVLRQTAPVPAPKLDYITTGVSIATNLASISLSVIQIFTGQTTLAGLRQLSKNLDTEFSGMKKNIAEIRNQLDEVHWVIPNYQDFEVALRNTLLDIEFPPPNDPEIFQKRGMYLHDELRTFLRGMLGTNIVLGDIVATIFKRQVISVLVTKQEN